MINDKLLSRSIRCGAELMSHNSKPPNRLYATRP